ncbi:hypothetical protein [Actinomadura roseirufa]|nr:hypothetical protein [Actinomadura roseirufa]
MEFAGNIPATPASLIDAGNGFAAIAGREPRCHEVTGESDV